LEFFPDDGDEHVGGHGAPYLRLHGVLAVAEEMLDAQMLLDPLEEQLDLPATLVQRRDRFSSYLVVFCDVEYRVVILFFV
jgi:hypothetical protein